MKKICLTLLLLFFTCQNIYAEDVSRVDVSGLANISQDIVLDVISIAPGDPFSMKEVEDAANNLRRWGVFSKIETALTPTSEGVAIDFNLEEADIVVAVDIEGNYPYLENKIRKYLTIHPGDVLTEEKVLEQIDRVKAFYEREGIVETEVYVQEEAMPEWGGTVLTFSIDHGHMLRYRNIGVTGNRAYPKGRFISALNPAMHFSERRLSDSIRRLREFYQSHGYPKIKIKVRDKKIDIDKLAVDLALEVSEGPKVDVSFKGAPYVSNRRLKKTITILKEGSLDNFEMQASCDAIKELMQEKGFPNADVTYEKVTKKNGNILVTFRINEGKEERIRFLKFSGSEGVNYGVLAGEMQNREMASGIPGTYYPESEGDDSEAIKKALTKKGYLSAEVLDWQVAPTPQGYALDITVPLVAGPQTIVRDVVFDGNKSATVENLLKELKNKPGSPLDVPALEEDRGKVLAYYADNGHPYADVKQAWDYGDALTDAIVRYDIDEGVEVKIGKILFIGDVMTSQKALMKAMEIHEGDLFSYRKVVDSQLSIRRLGPFAAVTIETIGIQEHEPRVFLKVKVEEQRPFLVDIGVNYSTDESFTGTLSFSNVNAFGWAKTNSFKLIGGQKLSRAEISWIDPRFLSSSFEMTGMGWVQYKQRPSYAYTQLGGSVGWMRRFRRFGLFFRYEIDRNHFLQGDSVAANADSLRNNILSGISISSSFDSRDSFADPRKGFYTLGGVDIYNEIKGPGANFFRFAWQGENDLTFLRYFTLSTALRFNRIQTVRQGVSVPTNLLYFLGGDDTIRGFAEDSLGPQNAAGRATGARTRWVLNEELRLRMWRALAWVFFLDMGSLGDNFDSLTWYQTRRAFGMGLRYITPVGPIRAEYAFKLDRHTGESRGRFHFTFGYVF